MNAAGGNAGLATKVFNKAQTLDLEAFRAVRAKDNRVDRNFDAGDQVGVIAGVGIINAYNGKGVNKATAGLLYNVGLNGADLADAAVAGNTNATTFQYTPAHANAVGTGVATDYDLTDPAGLMAYVTARSLDKDPRLDAGDTN